MAKRADEIIAQTLCWDVAEVREYRYQRYSSPVVYAIGNRYFAVHRSKPKHDVAGEWKLHSDQACVPEGRFIWVAEV